MSENSILLISGIAGIFKCKRADDFVKLVKSFATYTPCRTNDLPDDQKCSHCGLSLLWVFYYLPGIGPIQMDLYYCHFCNPESEGGFLMTLEPPSTFLIIAELVIKHSNLLPDWQASLEWWTLSFTDILRKALFDNRITSGEYVFLKLMYR